MSKISVIIPAYNAEQAIEKCLLSLMQQSFTDFEIIVVDDNSTDKTSEIASKYTKVIKLDKKTDVGAARNIGAEESKGEVLVFTDSDVVLPKDWLSNIVKDMREHNVKCVGGGYCGSVGNSFLERFAHLELAYRRRNLPELVNTLVANNFACSREVFFEFGGFPEKFKCEDLRLSYKISKKYPIFWDKNNGVLHHFKPALKEYLLQQYCFGKDTVLSYCQFPGMLFRQTHQGRGIYLQALLMFILIAVLFFIPVVSIFLLILILLSNLDFLSYLKSNNLPLLRSFLVVLSRNLIFVVSIFAGIFLCLKETVRNLFARPLKNL